MQRAPHARATLSVSSSFDSQVPAKQPCLSVSDGIVQVGADPLLHVQLEAADTSSHLYAFASLTASLIQPPQDVS